jgi:hypothetical protein
MRVSITINPCMRSTSISHEEVDLRSRALTGY